MSDIGTESLFVAKLNKDTGGYYVMKRSRPGVYLVWLGGDLTKQYAVKRATELNNKYGGVNV